MSSTTKPTVAFFGATGGCALAALVQTLQAGHNATALARTPLKLTNLLTARGISESTISTHLTITQGNAKDQHDVERALVVPSTGTLADVIVTGVGGSPTITWYGSINLDDSKVCADSMTTLLAALAALQTQPQHSAKKPLLCAISTTGISRVQRDVPLLFVPLYHWLLAEPHKDKVRMEKALEDVPADGKFSWTVVRASLLTDGAAVGSDKLRVGWEKSGAQGEPGPALGYTISREDVGRWIFEELVAKEGRGEWDRRLVSITA